jgi:hypothetical protein
LTHQLNCTGDESKPMANRCSSSTAFSQWDVDFGTLYMIKGVIAHHGSLDGPFWAVVTTCMWFVALATQLLLRQAPMQDEPAVEWQLERSGLFIPRIPPSSAGGWPRLTHCWGHLGQVGPGQGHGETEVRRKAFALPGRS